MSISTTITWKITDTIRDKSDGFITEAEARGQLSELIQKPGFVNSKLSPKNLTEDSVLAKMNDGVLKGRTLNSKAIREYLGEYTGRSKPGVSLESRRSDLSVKLNETLKRQSGIISKGNYLKYLKEYNDTLPAGNKVFLDEVPPGLIDIQGDKSYVKLSDVMVCCVKSR